MGYGRCDVRWPQWLPMGEVRGMGKLRGTFGRHPSTFARHPPTFGCTRQLLPLTRQLLPLCLEDLNPVQLKIQYRILYLDFLGFYP
jgi:hypothetical protein